MQSFLVTLCLLATVDVDAFVPKTRPLAAIARPSSRTGTRSPRFETARRADGWGDDPEEPSEPFFEELNTAGEKDMFVPYVAVSSSVRPQTRDVRVRVRACA